MQFDREKLKTVILYICAQSHQSNLGAVKLNKVLYYADMIHYAHVGTPITGATYRKRAFGPVCENLLSILRELQKEGRLEIRETDYFGYRKKEYIARVAADASRLSEGERVLLNEVIDFVCDNNTAKTISEFSHNRAWEMAEFGDVIPYTSSFLLYPTQVSPEAMEWAAQEVKSGVLAEEEALECVPVEDFRARILEARRHK